MDDQEEVWAYMQKLGKLISEKLHDSDEIKEIVKKLQELQLNVQLSFVALVKGSRPLVSPLDLEEDGGRLEFRVTEADREFLEQLGIRYDEEDELLDEEI